MRHTLFFFSTAHISINWTVPLFNKNAMGCLLKQACKRLNVGTIRLKIGKAGRQYSNEKLH